MFDKQEYRITVGLGEDREGKQLTLDEVLPALHRIRTAFSVQFGGYTGIGSSGGWINEHDKTITETGIVFSVLVDFKPEDDSAPLSTEATNDETVICFARWAGQQLNQHSVVVIAPDGSAGIFECPPDAAHKREADGIT